MWHKLPYLVTKADMQEIMGLCLAEWQEPTYLGVGTIKVGVICSMQTTNEKKKKEVEKVATHERVSQNKKDVAHKVVAEKYHYESELLQNKCVAKKHVGKEHAEKVDTMGVNALASQHKEAQEQSE